MYKVFKLYICTKLYTWHAIEQVHALSITATKLSSSLLRSIIYRISKVHNKIDFLIKFQNFSFFFYYKKKHPGFYAQTIKVECFCLSNLALKLVKFYLKLCKNDVMEILLHRFSIHKTGSTNIGQLCYINNLSFRKCFLSISLMWMDFVIRSIIIRLHKAKIFRIPSVVSNPFWICIFI